MKKLFMVTYTVGGENVGKPDRDRNPLAAMLGGACDRDDKKSVAVSAVSMTAAIEAFEKSRTVGPYRIEACVAMDYEYVDAEPPLAAV